MLVHLIELRRRLLWVTAAFLLLFIVFFVHFDKILHILLTPLLPLLPKNGGIIATELTAPFWIPVSLAINTAALVTSPLLLYHLWQFARPGLYGDERKNLSLIISLSITLFMLGLAFGFFIILPYMFNLLVHVNLQDVKLMPDLGSTLNFILRMLSIFGICFQIPLLCLMLVRVKVVDRAGLKKMRPYAIVLAFIIGMLLTPPDVVSQILLAVPLCLLFEGGTLLVGLFERF